MEKTGIRRRYVPAAGKDWLLPLYDPIQGLFGGDAARRELIEQAQIQPGQRILDLGCGTGSLVAALKGAVPGAEVIGLDPDPLALERARRKCARAAVAVRFDRGFSDELPYAAGSFERVLSSFMLHHLGTEEKRRTLAEVRRVLRPGGSLHLLDFGGGPGHSGGLLARLLHAAEHLRDNLAGRIPELLRDAGFADAGETAHRRSVFGRIAYYRGSVAAS
jgi:ubiquinone/menaquinone biosynthesis C-methylase UbiE